MENQSEILFYTAEDGKTKIQVRLDEDTVWLTQEQMAELFQRERTVITKHIANAFSEGELAEESNVQKMHIANSDKPITFRNCSNAFATSGVAKGISTNRLQIFMLPALTTNPRIN